MNKKVSCGGHLVTIVSGIPIKYVQALHPDDSAGWSESWVIAFLKLAGYSMYEVPQNYDETRRGFERFFYPDHLMVYLLGIDNKEVTWCCSYGDKMWHGQNMFKGLTVGEAIINCPVEKMFMCCPTSQLTTKKHKKFKK